MRGKPGPAAAHVAHAAHRYSAAYPDSATSAAHRDSLTRLTINAGTLYQTSTGIGPRPHGRPRRATGASPRGGRLRHGASRPPKPVEPAAGI